MSPRRVWGPAQAWPRLHTCAARVHHLSLPEVPRACVVYWYRSIWGFGLAKCSKAGVDENTHQHKYFTTQDTLIRTLHFYFAHSD